jgi:pimeloyl-ACP methyl ester carboxylesterase
VSTGCHTVRGAGEVPIAYWATGSGPPLLLVHGSLGDHTRWAPLLPFLEPHFSVHVMDRRGRGHSGDATDYAITYEYEDVARVVEDIADRHGVEVPIYGHSYGGLCVFGATALTNEVGHLVLYEAWPPPDPEPFAPPPGMLEEMESLLEAGEPEAVIETALRVSAGLSDEEIAAYRAQSSWPARVAAAPTYPREERAFAETVFDPDVARGIRNPTLLLVGEKTPPGLWQVETVAAAMPDARVVTLPGQGHAADVLDPGRVASAMIAFLTAD